MLKLICITNDVTVAKVVENAKVDRIMVDLEKKGKLERQRGWNSVISNHTIADVARIRKVCNYSEMIVRINPIDDESEYEIEEVLTYNPDILMLPYFKEAWEVEKFVSCVNKRAKTCILLETSEAVSNIDEILSIEGIDEVYIGLVDLSHSTNKRFVFECLSDGLVEYIISKVKEHNIKNYGFGGIANVGFNKIPAEMIIGEHYRLGSNSVILSRAFFEKLDFGDADKLQEEVNNQIELIRRVEYAASIFDAEIFEYNKKRLHKKIKEIVAEMNNDTPVNVLIAGNVLMIREDKFELAKKNNINIDFLNWEKDTVENPEKYDFVVCNNLFLYNDVREFTNLKGIQLISAGFSTELKNYADNHNIALYNAKGVYSAPIAEMIIMQILNICKNTKAFIKKQENKIWEKDRSLTELSGKTVMFVGYGAIAKETAKRLSLFDVNIIVANRSEVNDEYVSKWISLNEMHEYVKFADIVIVCIAGNEETTGIIDKSFLKQMKDGSIFVNVSRGYVVDEKALIEEIKNEKFRGVALDVFENEPLDPNSPLWECENVYITPHNGFISDGNQGRLFKLTFNNFKKHFSKGE